MILLVVETIVGTVVDVLIDGTDVEDVLGDSFDVAVAVTLAVALSLVVVLIFALFVVVLVVEVFESIVLGVVNVDIGVMEECVVVFWTDVVDKVGNSFDIVVVDLVVVVLAVGVMVACDAGIIVVPVIEVLIAFLKWT